MRPRVTGILIVMAVLASTAWAAHASASTSTGASSATTSRAKNERTCAWRARADKQTLNIAYPDTSATYWGMTYALAPDEHLELTGRFPTARYASFVSYGPAGGAIDVLTDRDIDPDRGSANPFRATNEATGSRARKSRRAYTVEIRPDSGPTTEPNVLGARASVEPQPTTTTSTTSPGAAQPVIVGSGGPDAVRGSVIYRVYLPRPKSDPKGGVTLPRVKVVDASGKSERVPVCAKPGPSQAAIDIVNNFNRTINPAPATPIFIRPAASQVNLYPNPDNVYVATVIAHQPGRIVVIRGRAPTFPDTNHGARVTGNEQVRFWSMCTNEFRKPYPVTECAADDGTQLDADGYYTYVISTPADRPRQTSATRGSTWLDWGSTKVDALLIVRNMLASPSFPEATSTVAAGALARSTMGDYTPRGAYCDKQLFESGGFAACGL